MLPIRSLIALLAVLSASYSPPTSAGDRYVIEHVNVLPMTSDIVLRDQTVVVSEGRISKICGLGVSCGASDAVHIDGRNGYLIPGLSDMHAHVDIPSFLPPEAPLDAKASADQTMRQLLRLYVLHGVTTVRDMSGGPEGLAARQRILRGEQIGPRLFVPSKAMDGDPPLHGGSLPFSTPEAAADYVRASAAAGYDFIKIYSTLPPATFDAIASAARQAGLPFAGHLPMPVDLEKSLASGQRSIEHLSGYDVACTPPEDRTPATMEHVYQGWAYCTKEKIAALASLTRRYPVWNTPTLVVADSVLPEYERSVSDGPGYLADLNPRIPPALRNNTYFYQIFKPRPRAGLKGTRAARQGLVKALAGAGAPLLVGTDTPAAGFNVHQELALLVEAGLSPFQALAAATVEPARYFDRAGEFGTVTVGSSADLVLLDANPLDDIGNTHRIIGVMVRGDWWPRARLDAEFAKLDQEFSATATSPDIGR